MVSLGQVQLNESTKSTTMKTTSTEIQQSVHIHLSAKYNIDVKYKYPFPRVDYIAAGKAILTARTNRSNTHVQ